MPHLCSWLPQVLFVCRGKYRNWKEFLPKTWNAGHQSCFVIISKACSTHNYLVDFSVIDQDWGMDVGKVIGTEFRQNWTRCDDPHRRRGGLPSFEDGISNSAVTHPWSAPWAGCACGKGHHTRVQCSAGTRFSETLGQRPVPGPHSHSRACARMHVRKHCRCGAARMLPPQYFLIVQRGASRDFFPLHSWLGQERRADRLLSAPASVPQQRLR